MGTKTNTAANLTKNGYEAIVKARAIARAGGCNNINGHILEIMGQTRLISIRLIC